MAYVYTVYVPSIPSPDRITPPQPTPTTYYNSRSKRRRRCCCCSLGRSVGRSPPPPALVSSPLYLLTLCCSRSFAYSLHYYAVYSFLRRRAVDWENWVGGWEIGSTCRVPAFLRVWVDRRRRSRQSVPFSIALPYSIPSFSRCCDSKK